MIVLLLGVAALAIGITLTVLAGRRLNQPGRGDAERLQSVLDALPDGILQCDTDGRIQFTNASARRLIGRQDGVSAFLPTVLVLLDRVSREPRTPRLWEDLRRGTPSSLPAGTCLISGAGMEFEVEGNGTPLFDANGLLTGSIVTLRDVTEHVEAQRRQPVRLEADDITGLPVERILVEKLERNLLSKRAVDRELAYLHIELDGIDSLVQDAGQATANGLLREAAQVMLSRVRDTDTLSPLGGNAFGLLLPACPQEISERIVQTLADSVQAMSFDWQDRTYRLSARIGIVHSPPFAGAYDECQAEAAKSARSQAK